jgi:pimeloyl-ACP methyl ester carboxylesterase
LSCYQIENTTVNQRLLSPHASRRQIGVALLATAAATVLPGCASTATTAPAPRKTFVLLAPGWAGAWVYRDTIAQLRAQGHTVYAPTLTGLADRSHLRTAQVNLDTHIRDVVDLLKWEDLKDVVLVGHSTTGAVVAGVAEQALPRIGSVVMLNAYLHEDGRSVFDYMSARVQADITARLAKGETGLPPPPASYYAMPPAPTARAQALLSPQPLGAMTQKVKVTGALERVPKKTYVMLATFARGKDFETVHYRRAQSLPGWTTREVEMGHLPMLDQPEAFTRLLLSVA